MTKKIKVIFLCTESWFFLSHFKPLAEAINSDDKYESCIITTVGKNEEELKNLGLKVLPVNFMRSSFSLLAVVKICLQLIGILRRERPDIVHSIALRPVFFGGVATFFSPKTARVFHVTGMGYLADGNSKLTVFRRKLFFRLVAFFTNQSRSWLVVENPDDLKFLAKYGASKEKRTTILGGAGVDPEYFCALPPATSTIPKAAYIGRMIWSKGVDILVAAKAELEKRSVPLDVDLYGAPDFANPHAIKVDTIENWGRQPGVKWHGLTNDVREVWRNSEIGIMPTRTREGMPRAMLEAAASGRALIVTDVPGCRHFVRNGIEGLVVPPEDPYALADAMQKLAENAELRLSLGLAARKRVLSGYTERHVRKAIMRVYNILMSSDMK